MATKKKSKKAVKSKRILFETNLQPKSKARKKRRKKKTTKKRGRKKKSARAIKAAKPSRQKTSRGKSARERAAFKQETGPDSAGQSGDLQGLRDVEGADSESVDELLEEGNAFEADAVAGVERADDNDGQEVHTHEVPEDDVPEEYLDKDS